MRAVKSFVVVMMLVLLGCKKDKPTPPPENGSGSGSAITVAIGSGSADVGSGSGSGSAAVETAGSGELQDVGSAVDPTAMSHHAQHCPSMVRGAVTTEKLDGKSVIVTITSDDPKAASKIQMRTDKLLADKAKLPAEVPSAGHAQNGSHGGAIGICPVHVPEGGTAKSTKIANGVVVTVTPKSGAEALEKDIDARIVRAADWLKHNPPGDGDGNGDGGGSGKGGGSGDARHGHRHS